MATTTILLAAMLMLGATPRADSPVPTGLDSLLDRAMATNGTPGLSVAVVEGDSVVWTAVRGWADRERKRPVTPETRFYVASTTKALTATAAACLAARGALDLDAPLSRALPLARFHAGVHPESIRVVDLLTHTHGIDPAGPVSVRVAYTGDFTYPDLERALAAHGPASTGRAFAYSNLGYDLAGIVLDPAHEGGWKNVVQREVTGPLGMRATTMFRSQVPDDRLARPYACTPDGFEPLRLAKEDANMGPAGGCFSTSGDLARLLVAELNAGHVAGHAGLPPSVVAETRRLHVAQSGRFDGYERFGWGLGWDLGTYAGDTLVHRFGSFPGYGCHLSFMPSHRLGVVVLVNASPAGMLLADVVANAIYDRMLGRTDATPRADSELGSLAKRIEKLRDAIAGDRAKRAARPQSLPHPLAAYAGTYVNPDWGTLTLRVVGRRLEARMGVARSAVETYDAATNRLRIELFGGGDVMQAIFPDGAVRSSALELEGVTFLRR